MNIRIGTIENYPSRKDLRSVRCENCGSDMRTLETRDDGKTWLCVDLLECMKKHKIPIKHVDRGPTIIPVKVRYSC